MHTYFDHCYLDNNSTTALRAEVLEAMLPFMTTQYGNATSRHAFGRTARAAVEQARSQVAAAVGAQANQVVFTANGTEANNFAVQGMTTGFDASQILVSSIEHPCVSRPAKALQARGWQSRAINVNEHCQLDMAHLQNLLQAPTQLVSVMLANNETGVIQPLAEVAQLARANKAYVHTDAVQALGKIPVNFAALGVHAMTVSSHKIGGPLGAGALVLDKRVDIQPLLHGGGQEKGLRSGTENVAAIVGFGKACELAVLEQQAFHAHTQALRDHVEQGLQRLNAVIFGQAAPRLSNTSFFAFPNMDGETLVIALDKAGFAVASGSACSSDSDEPSHVLLAMGVETDLARGAVRVSLGMHNTLAEVAQFITALEKELNRLKQMLSIAA
jgi:cysteine desulfurase